MNDDIFDMLMGNGGSESAPYTGATPTLESDTDRAMIVMAALQESCTQEEYDEIMSNPTALELFQVIPSASTAMEAVEKRIARYTLSSKLSQATKATCLRMAKEAGDPLYTKYRNARLKMFEFREKIYAKYTSKASRTAKQIVRGAKNSAKSMKNKTGDNISDKLDKTLKKIEKESK